MSYFRRGRHRAGRHSVLVADLADSIERERLWHEMWAERARLWESRTHRAFELFA